MRLRQIREQAGYSQQDLADESGVSQHTISEIELGRRKPQGRTLRKLAQALDVEVADFYPKALAPLSAEWARSTPDDDAFRHRIEDAPPEILRGLVLELVVGYQPRLLESVPSESPEELGARVRAFSRVNVICEELLRRGEELPKRYPLALRRFEAAMTASEGQLQQSNDEQEGQEAAG